MSRSPRLALIRLSLALLFPVPLLAQVDVADIGTINRRQSAAFGVNDAGWIAGWNDGDGHGDARDIAALGVQIGQPCR